MTDGEKATQDYPTTFATASTCWPVSYGSIFVFKPEPRKRKGPPFYRGLVTLTAPPVPAPRTLRFEPPKWKPLMGRRTVDRT